jgi:hypothetical protein
MIMIKKMLPVALKERASGLRTPVDVALFSQLHADKLRLLVGELDAVGYRGVLYDQLTRLVLERSVFDSNLSFTHLVEDESFSNHMIGAANTMGATSFIDTVNFTSRTVNPEVATTIVTELEAFINRSTVYTGIDPQVVTDLLFTQPTLPSEDRTISAHQLKTALYQFIDEHHASNESIIDVLMMNVKVHLIMTIFNHDTMYDVISHFGRIQTPADLKSRAATFTELSSQLRSLAFLLQFVPVVSKAIVYEEVIELLLRRDALGSTVQDLKNVLNELAPFVTFSRAWLNSIKKWGEGSFFGFSTFIDDHVYSSYALYLDLIEDQFVQTPPSENFVAPRDVDPLMRALDNRAESMSEDEVITPFHIQHMTVQSLIGNYDISTDARVALTARISRTLANLVYLLEDAWYQVQIADKEFSLSFDHLIRPEVLSQPSKLLPVVDLGKLSQPSVGLGRMPAVIGHPTNQSITHVLASSRSRIAHASLDHFVTSYIAPWALESSYVPNLDRAARFFATHKLDNQMVKPHYPAIVAGDGVHSDLMSRSSIASVLEELNTTMHDFMMSQQIVTDLQKVALNLVDSFVVLRFTPTIGSNFTIEQLRPVIPNVPQYGLTAQAKLLLVDQDAWNIVNGTTVQSAAEGFFNDETLRTLAARGITIIGSVVFMRIRRVPRFYRWTPEVYTHRRRLWSYHPADVNFETVDDADNLSPESLFASGHPPSWINQMIPVHQYTNDGFKGMSLFPSPLNTCSYWPESNPTLYGDELQWRFTARITTAEGQISVDKSMIPVYPFGTFGSGRSSTFGIVGDDDYNYVRPCFMSTYEAVTLAAEQEASKLKSIRDAAAEADKEQVATLDKAESEAAEPANIPAA